MKARGNKLTLGPDDVFTVPPGTPHRFWNDGDDEVRFVCEVRPALQFESLLETMFTLAEDGKTNKKGMPNPLRLAVIARAHFDTVRLPPPPAWMQRAGLEWFHRLLKEPRRLARRYLIQGVPFAVTLFRTAALERFSAQRNLRQP